MTALLLPPLEPERVRRLVDQFTRTAILVLGDAMLDRFLVGRVTRISPEAPVPVVAFDREMQRIGGAANVAHNVRALGGRVELVGVVGRDESGERLVDACRDAGIRTSLIVDPTRRTTTKVRIVTERNQQVARVDYEDDREIADAVEDAVVTEVHRRAEHAGAIVVSDYLKGCITSRAMSEAVSIGRHRGIPVVVDPKIPHLDSYHGATLVTPNHHEAETATHRRVRTHEDARDAAREFRALARCAGVLMTRGDAGMWLLDDTAEGYLPASAREVADVTGAGDTVVATLALALAAGALSSEAARLANEAAGIAVGKFGPSTVSPSELIQTVGDSAGT